MPYALLIKYEDTKSDPTKTLVHLELEMFDALEEMDEYIQKCKEFMEQNSGRCTRLSFLPQYSTEFKWMTYDITRNENSTGE